MISTRRSTAASRRTGPSGSWRYPELGPELKAYFDDLDQLLPAVSTKDYPGPPPQRSASDDHPGDALGDYILLEELGRGGQGVVWKAHPRHSPETVVALKTLATPSVRDEASIHRLRVDARTIARMDHPNIIKTYYYGEDRGRWFYVMELMKGETVASRIKSYMADLRASVVLLEKVARAIHHAHNGNPGVLHLDLKPGNILLTSDGDPRVADFGLSIRLETLERSDQVSGVKGTERSRTPGTRSPRPTPGPGSSGRSRICRRRWPLAAGPISPLHRTSTGSARSCTQC